MNLHYLFLRLVRHFLPEKLVRFLLLRGWIIHPGIETSSPEEAASRYIQTLAEKGISVEGKKILIFGYGGRFSLGLALLRAGAGHIILVDKYAPPDDAHNAGLIPSNQSYLEERRSELQKEALPRAINMLLSGTLIFASFWNDIIPGLSV